MKKCNVEIEEITSHPLLEMLSTDEIRERVCIMPESVSNEDYILNEYAPDFNKIAHKENIPSKLIISDDDEKNQFLDLKDADILLPFIISISAAFCYDLIKAFVLRYVSDFIGKTIKARIITKRKRNSKYEKIELKGDAESVIKALEVLRNDEDSVETTEADK